jgi:UDP-N-acetylglucosamine acyltransferase
VIRENATLHRAMNSEGATQVGDDCLIMVAAHVAHDCRIGNHVVLTNNVMLAGHVSVGDRAYLGGGSAVHQFCNIGSIAMVGGLARIDQDVLPYVMVDGESNRVVGLNKVGLRRAGIDSAERSEIKRAYHHIFHDGLPLEDLKLLLQTEFASGAAAEFALFLAQTTRGFVRERRRMARPTLRLVAEDSAVDDDLAEAA